MGHYSINLILLAELVGTNNGPHGGRKELIMSHLFDFSDVYEELDLCDLTEISAFDALMIDLCGFSI